MNTLPETNRRFLVVDDDSIFRTRLAKSLRSRNFEVFEAANADEALSCVAIHHPHYILTDLRMPGLSGLELVKKVTALKTGASIVVFTGYGSIATAIEAVREGAVHYLTKPADVDEILTSFERSSSEPQETAPARTPSLSEVEWEHIQRVLSDCGGNITHAAERLGIHRRSLQRKLEKLP